ncbi:MAG: hypothetical protein Q8O35_13835 [Humidesulfovibrio sp.]|uniref:hypothetical protein n=1 Tax=Humidesulfovibrio sp. TaxID=2910988 RepID=UPI0027363D61|nr:hypothetical protein [Humidesulfovibrio sp.]MDP2849249.1 hypothetical protein [Humidesulfovibrio sp.]
MTLTIGTNSTAGATPLFRAGAEAVARPQVQTSRVSLNLGPFGISYSTERVLWTEAMAAAAAQTLSAGGATSSAVETKGPVAALSTLEAASQDGVDGRQAQAMQAEATSRIFNLELVQAVRRQVEERSRAGQTYGRNGALNSGGAQKTGQATASAASAANPPEAVGGAAANSSGISANPAGRQNHVPPATRMRQAIGAYLACASNFSTTPPMLSAVA